MKASTHDGSVGVDIAVVECDCATVDADATSVLPNNRSTSVKASTPSGRWGGFMMASAYSGKVVVDIAAVERDCAAVDGDATSILPNNKARQYKRAPHRGIGMLQKMFEGPADVPPVHRAQGRSKRRDATRGVTSAGRL